MAARASASSSSSADKAFPRRVLLAVSRIPPGRVCTYGDVASLAGAPGAARAAGSVLARANRPGLPYHRVIAAGGRLGGYSDLHVKRLLLESEGVRVVGRRVKDFARLRWLPQPLSIASP